MPAGGASLEVRGRRATGHVGANTVARVDAVRPDEQRDGFQSLEVRVEHISAVSGFLCQLEQAAGRTLTVHAPEAVVQERVIRPVVTVAYRIRRTDPHDAFVHPEDVQVCGALCLVC